MGGSPKKGPPRAARYKVGVDRVKESPVKRALLLAQADAGVYFSPPCEGGVRGGGPKSLRIVSMLAVRP